MSWFLGYFQSWDISTASVRTTVCHCGVVSSRLLSQCEIREELLKCPGRACPCLFCAQLSCGEGEALGLLVLGCSMRRCSLSRARALHRDHRGCFWICWAETTLRFVLLAAERFGQRISCEHKHSQGSGFRQISLFQRRNRHTGTHSPHTDCWMSGRHLEKVVGFDGFVILSLAVGCEQKLEAPASLSCRRGTDPRLSWASRAESSLVLTQNSKGINYFLWLVISGHFLSRTCKLRLLFSWQRSIKGKGNASITCGCVTVGFENQILT